MRVLLTGFVREKGRIYCIILRAPEQAYARKIIAKTLRGVNFEAVWLLPASLAASLRRRETGNLPASRVESVRSGTSASCAHASEAV